MKRLCILLAVAALLLTGCASMTVGMNTYTPENGVLVYGMYFIAENAAVPEIAFCQIDPDFEPLIYEGLRSELTGTITFIVPPNGFYKAFKYKTFGYRSVYTWFFGLQGVDAWDFYAPSEPGLLYTGSWIYMGDGKYEENKKYDELYILKAIESKFKKTSWAGLIAARIQELENE